MAKTKTLVYAALCVALAVLLSNVKVYRLPQGGSVTACSMLFIALAGYWFGPVIGLLAGVSNGLLQLILDPYVIHPAQLLLDYPLAFGVLGLSGFFWKKPIGSRMNFNLHIGYTVGVLARLLVSTLSGFIFFSEYAPEGTHPMLYSLGYNASYMLPEMVITLFLISVPAFRKVIDLISVPKRV